jgi:FkbM family methyltransferase
MMDNLKRNDIENVQVENRACSGSTGTAELYIPNNHHVSSLRLEHAKGSNSEVRTVRVGTTTLDDHWQKAAMPGERVVFGED